MLARSTPIPAKSGFYSRFDDTGIQLTGSNALDLGGGHGLQLGLRVNF